MYRCSPDPKFVHFADDTTIVATSDSEHALFKSVNRALGLIDKWSSINRLSLNLKKTNYMLITDNSDSGAYQVRLKNRKIKRTSIIKFLGIVLDDRLSFMNHVASDGRAPGEKERRSRSLQENERRSRSFIIKGARYRSRSSKKIARSFRRSFRKILNIGYIVMIYIYYS